MKYTYFIDKFIKIWTFYLISIFLFKLSKLTSKEYKMDGKRQKIGNEEQVLVNLMFTKNGNTVGSHSRVRTIKNSQ